MLVTEIYTRLLPKPLHASVADEEDDVRTIQPVVQASTSQSVVIRTVVPPYGQRAGWKPTSQEDFGEYSAIPLFYPKSHSRQATVVHTLNVTLHNIHLVSGRRRRLQGTRSPFKSIARVTSATTPSPIKVNGMASSYSRSSRISSLSPTEKTFLRSSG